MNEVVFVVGFLLFFVSYGLMIFREDSGSVWDLVFFGIVVFVPVLLVLLLVPYFKKNPACSVVGTLGWILMFVCYS